MNTVIIIVMSVIFLGLLLTEYFLLKKYWEDGIKELKMHYEDVIEATRKETEHKTRELCLKEPIEIKRTFIDTKRYEKSIILDSIDIESFESHDELDKFLRTTFADAFAKELLEPNLVINEEINIVPHKKKYFTKVHVGF